MRVTILPVLRLFLALLGHESISTTRLYDKRKDRPEESPAFKSNIDLSPTPGLHFGEVDRSWNTATPVA